jgi:hypothetical protein
LKAIAERRREHLLISGIDPTAIPRTQIVSESKALREEILQLENRLRVQLEDLKRDGKHPISFKGVPLAVPLAVRDPRSPQSAIDLTSDDLAQPKVSELNITTGHSKISPEERDILKGEKRMDDGT